MILFSLNIFSLLFKNSFLFSRLETTKINKLKTIKRICRDEVSIFNASPKKDSKIIMKADLKKTIYLNTPIIEIEWITRLNSDIFEGPKYLKPLIEFTSFRFDKCFFRDPEKLLHKLSLVDRIFTSFLVKQL